MRPPSEQEGWTGADREGKNANYMWSGIWRFWNCRKMHGIGGRGCLGGRGKLGSSLCHWFFWVIPLTSLNLSSHGFEIRQIKCITNSCQNQDSEEQWRHILANIYWGSAEPLKSNNKATFGVHFTYYIHRSGSSLQPPMVVSCRFEALLVFLDFLFIRCFLLHMTTFRSCPSLS